MELLGLHTYALYHRLLSYFTPSPSHPTPSNPLIHAGLNICTTNKFHPYSRLFPTPLTPPSSLTTTCTEISGPDIIIVFGLFYLSTWLVKIAVKKVANLIYRGFRWLCKSDDSQGGGRRRSMVIRTLRLPVLVEKGQLESPVEEPAASGPGRRTGRRGGHQVGSGAHGPRYRV